jgi:probable Rubsico expression protein CbbX
VASDALSSPIDIGAALAASAVEDIFAALDSETVGLVPVKTRLREIAALLLVAKLRESAGLSSHRPTLHMCFTGAPGTGKTTVAGRVGNVLHRLGYLRKGHLVVATRDDLVGQYVGHTAPKTKEMIKRALGGVLFIDEAYYLHRPENERDYGQEAVEMLLTAMETHRDDLVVILAGYADRMDAFFNSNPGIHSRVAHHVAFPDYSTDELMQIAELMLAAQHYHFDDEARVAFAEYLQHRVQQPHFANARSVRNALDRAKLRHAARLVAQGGTMEASELARIDARDIRASRVFNQSATVADIAGE